MKTQELHSEDELIDILAGDIVETDKNRVVMQAGHFPVIYSDGRANEGLSAWGDFSRYSLNLAAKVAQTAKILSSGKEIRFALIADDRSYEPTSQMSKYQRSAARNRLYKQRNGAQATLPEEFHKILIQNGFSEKEVLRSNHDKTGREECLYFSEKSLIASGIEEKHECAQAYGAFIENNSGFNRDLDYLVSFIPDRCTGNICKGVLDREMYELKASHIFMQTEAIFLSKNSKNSIWENWGVSYRKED